MTNHPIYSYTFENMMFHVLHRRVPKFEHAGLTRWWCHGTKLYRLVQLQYAT